VTDKIRTVPLGGTARLDLNEYDPLPPLPNGVPKPRVSVHMMANNAQTVVTLNTVPVYFWETPGGGFDSYSDEGMRGGGPWGKFLNEEQVEAVREWGAAMHKRMAGLMYDVLMGALTEEVEARMVEFALEG
jgi:hypothetical protein